MTRPQQKKSTLWIWVVVIAVVGSVVLAMADEGVFDSSDNDTTVPVPTGQDTADLVARLADAEKAHGICYGWELDDSTYSTRPEDILSMGSSRGVNQSARECADWVILTVGVNYTSASSELEDSARIDVEHSGSLAGKAPHPGDLERMGVTGDAAVNDPAATVGLGALALPLLMVEQGAAEPLPAATATADPAVAIGHPGSDFLGNNTGALIALGIVGGLALLCLTVGLFIRNRGKEAR